MITPSVFKIRNYYYDTHDLIGSGGFGVVYKAYKDTDPKTPYALKIIQSKEAKNVEKEIEILNKLRNDKIIKLVDYIITGEGARKTYYKFFEYCEEGSLKSKLKTSSFKIEYEDMEGKKCLVPYLPEEQVIDYLKQIVEGFHYLSKENIIHRDLKPSNILFKNSKVKIIDFDFAEYIDHKETPSFRTNAYYTSPEAFVGDSENLSKCDVFSLGIILHELLFGRFPWTPKVKCEYQFFKESKKPIKFPLYPKISLQMKQLIFELLTHDQKKRPNWNEVCMRMDKLGFLSEISTPPLKLSRIKFDISKYYVSTMEDPGGENKNDGKKTRMNELGGTPIKKSRRKVDMSKYYELASEDSDDLSKNYVSTIEDSSGENKNEDKKMRKNELVGTPIKTSRTKVDISKYYKLAREDSDGENKNETNPKMKNRCGLDEKTTLESINVELKFANFFGCDFDMLFGPNKIFLLKDQNLLNLLRDQILDCLDRFAKNFYSDAKKKLKNLKKANPDLDELQTLEKKIKDHEFYSVEDVNDQPNYKEFRRYLKRFLKAHKFFFLKDNEKNLISGGYNLVFYKLFCICLRMVKAHQPFEIFAENEEDLLPQMFDDLLQTYDNMKLDDFLKEIRESLKIK